MRRIIKYVLVAVSALPLVAQDVPRYKLDPSWPKELPNHWILGEVEGIAVDKNDHVWVVHERTKVPPIDPTALRAAGGAGRVAAPSVVEFDAEGKVQRFWGGEGFVPDWPVKEHDILVDSKGNVWITGIWIPEFNLPAWRNKDKLLWDRQVLKFTSDGRLLLQIGRPSKSAINNQETAMLGGPSSVQLDEAANEVYIGDGYMNKRVLVYDSNTGAFKRGWGAYGIPLSEIDNSQLAAFGQSTFDPLHPSKQFRGPVDEVRLSTDGLLYVADSGGHRIQVFTRQGKFIKEFFIDLEASGRNAIGAVALSSDAKQRFLLVADEEREVVWVVNRENGTIIGQLALKGPDGEQIPKIDSLVLDSHGNLYVGDGHVNNKIQRWIVQR